MGAVEVVKSASASLKHGHTAVGTDREQLTVLQTATRGVLIVADPGNTGTVFVGGSAVTADTDAVTGGIPLSAEKSVFIPIDDPSLLHVIADDAAQGVAWMAL